MEQKQEQRSLDVLADHFAHTMHLMLAALIVLAVLLVGCVGVIIWQAEQRVELEREFETVEEYEYDIEQKADNSSNNVWVGRDYIYGSDTENAGQGDENPNP